MFGNTLSLKAWIILMMPGIIGRYALLRVSKQHINSRFSYPTA